MPTGVDLSKEFLAGFLAEADEHLTGASRLLLELESASGRGQAHPRAVRELFRSLHTLKGLSAMVDLQPVVDLAHELEGVLRHADRSGGHVTPGAVELLIRGTRALEERVRQVAAGAPPAPAPPALLAALAALLPRAATSAAPPPRAALPAELEAKLGASEREQLAQGMAGGRRVVRVDFVPSAERAAAGHNITRVREQLGRLGELVKVLPRAAPGTPGGLSFALLLVTDASDAALAGAAGLEAAQVHELAAPAPQPAAPSTSQAEVEVEAAAEALLPEAPPTFDEATGPGQAYVRVEVERLDDTLERLSALVVTHFRLSRTAAALAARGADTRALDAVLGEHARQVKALRGAIMRARMVRLAEVLGRVPLMVRGLTRGTDREVRLDMDTGRAEVDKSVAERLFPAVVHLVRNAVDHALEPRGERLQAGKPPEGRLTLRCDDSSGSHLDLVVEDDGRGVDRAAVARKAGQPVPESDAELLDLLCRPGLSTREQASHVSGRGMGMDIVQRTVEGLGGSLTLETEPGRGTRFTLRVPLSVTIVDTFGCVSGGQTFVVPVALVEEIIELDARRTVRPPRPGNGGHGSVAAPKMVERRGEVLPLLALDEALRLQGGPGAAAAAAAAAAQGPGAPPPKALVVRLRGAAIAFGVERMLGQQEVVVRPLEDPLVRAPGVAGATDLGDGRATLVLDLVALADALHAQAPPDRKGGALA